MGANAVSLNNNIFARLFSFFSKKREPAPEKSLAEIVTGEIDGLWTLVRERNEKEDCQLESECTQKIAESFAMLRTRYTDEQLDSNYVWPRFAKVAIFNSIKPIDALVEYVNESNYIYLTKRMSDLVRSVRKSEEDRVIDNSERFAETVYMHILEDINPADIPSLLSLGRAAQQRGNYEEAKKWYLKVTETDDPFNGLTALLASYEEEIKAILSRTGSNYHGNQKLKERVRELNRTQCSIYERWCRLMEEHISGNEVTENYKRDYVALLTGYARFERSRGDYKKAFDLLKRVPNTYPEMYRVYTEEAMLYQFKPYQNRYYSLEKAIEAFKKADAAIAEENGNGPVNAKSKKSILMPLANTYFQSGRYNEASDVCDIVLRIDEREQRAVNLKNRIACLASA